MADQYLSVTWNEFHSLSLLLAEQILTSKKPISTITIQSYTDIKKQGLVQITSKLGHPIRDKNILLVDDIADSGKTFVRAISYLGAFRPKSITTAALFYKPHSSFLPDFFAKQTGRWILLPHEVTEWISTFSNTMIKEGKSKTEIHAFLKKLGYDDKQIAFTQKYNVS